MKKVILTAIVMLTFFTLPPAIRAFSFDEAPKRIIIPKANISLPVYQAKIAYDTWEVRLDGASFGEGTALPGKIGNTVIFSHARPGLFEELPNLKKGEYIHVFTKNNWFAYKVEKTLTVDPEDTHVIAESHGHELTLYTCIGEGYTKRFVVKARPAYKL